MMQTAAAAAFPDWLRRRAQTSPEKTAIVCGSLRQTFAELDDAAAAVATNLEASGVKPGDRVALLAENVAEFAAAVFGISRLGAVLVPVNSRLTANEISAQLEDCGAALLLTDQTGPAFAAGTPTAGLAEVIGTGRGDYQRREPPLKDLDHVFSIIYTSGTTGRPKGAVLTYGNYLWNAFGSAVKLGLRDDDRWLACMPLFHVGGLSILVRSVLYGITAEIHESFDAARVAGALSAGEVTIVSLVPTMLRRILDERQRGFSPRLRCVLLGGGPVPADLVEDCLRRGIPVAPTYGLTEAASQVATLAPSEVAGRPGSAGKALMPVRLRIQREDGTDCGQGEPGEIAIAGPTVMAGYYRRPQETAEAWRGGWFHTGDFGYLDQDGYLYVLDRRDDLIVSGGENIYPAEVEAVLASHPAVNEAGVFALPDADWGQCVWAAVSLRDGAFAGEGELRAYCRSRLADYKTPKVIRFVPALPRNASGKLLRRELRTMFEREIAG